MSCDDCGRPSGHWLGCPVSVTGHGYTIASPDADRCAKDDCSNERAPQGKGPQPKYCTEHKTGSK